VCQHGTSIAEPVMNLRFTNGGWSNLEEKQSRAIEPQNING
jgi:hypothetical protein